METVSQKVDRNIHTRFLCKRKKMESECEAALTVDIGTGRWALQGVHSPPQEESETVSIWLNVSIPLFNVMTGFTKNL